MPDKLSQVIAYKHNGDVSKIYHGMQTVLNRDDMLVLYSAVGARVDNVRRQTHWDTHYAAYSPDGVLSIHDVEEFHERTVLYGYGPDLVERLLVLQLPLVQAITARRDDFSLAFYQMLKEQRI